MELLLIRHGESVGNLQGRIQGQADFPLTERGMEQTQALAERLLREERAISTIYASDLSRAAQTAEVLSAWLGVPIIFDSRLREYDAGVLNGLVWEEIEHLYPEIWRGLQVRLRDWSSSISTPCSVPPTITGAASNAWQPMASR